MSAGYIVAAGGKVQPSNPLDELYACLDVLGEYVDQTPDDPALYDSEFLTACWQTIELVNRLINEHQALLGMVDELMAAVEEQLEERQKISKLVVANAGDVKRLIK